MFTSNKSGKSTRPSSAHARLPAITSPTPRRQDDGDSYDQVILIPVSVPSPPQTWPPPLNLTPVPQLMTFDVTQGRHRGHNSIFAPFSNRHLEEAKAPADDVGKKLSDLEKEVSNRFRDLDQLKEEICSLKSQKTPSSPAPTETSLPNLPRRKSDDNSASVAEMDKLKRDKRVLSDLLKRSQRELTKRDLLINQLKRSNEKLKDSLERATSVERENNNDIVEDAIIAQELKKEIEKLSLCLVHVTETVLHSETFSTEDIHEAKESVATACSLLKDNERTFNTKEFRNDFSRFWSKLEESQRDYQNALERTHFSPELNEELLEELEGKSKLVEVLRHENRKQVEEKTELLEEIALKVKEVDSANENITELRMEVDTLAKKLELEQILVEAIKEESENLQKDVTEKDISLRRVETKASRLDEVTQEKFLLQKELVTVANTLEDVKGENVSLKSMADVLQAEIDRIQPACKELEDEVKRINEKVETDNEFQKLVSRTLELLLPSSDDQLPFESLDRKELLAKLEEVVQHHRKMEDEKDNISEMLHLLFNMQKKFITKGWSDATVEETRKELDSFSAQDEKIAEMKSLILQMIDSDLQWSRTLCIKADESIHRSVSEPLLQVQKINDQPSSNGDSISEETLQKEIKKQDSFDWNSLFENLDISEKDSLHDANNFSTKSPNHTINNNDNSLIRKSRSVDMQIEFQTHDNIFNEKRSKLSSSRSLPENVFLKALERSADINPDAFASWKQQNIPLSDVESSKCSFSYQKNCFSHPKIEEESAHDVSTEVHSQETQHQRSNSQCSVDEGLSIIPELDSEDENDQFSTNASLNQTFSLENNAKHSSDDGDSTNKDASESLDVQNSQSEASDTTIIENLNYLSSKCETSKDALMLESSLLADDGFDESKKPFDNSERDSTVTAINNARDVLGKNINSKGDCISKENCKTENDIEEKLEDQSNQDLSGNFSNLDENLVKINVGKVLAEPLESHEQSSLRSIKSSNIAEDVLTENSLQEIEELRQNENECDQHSIEIDENSGIDSVKLQCPTNHENLISAIDNLANDIVSEEVSDIIANDSNNIRQSGNKENRLLLFNAGEESETCSSSQDFSAETAVNQEGRLKAQPSHSFESYGDPTHTGSSFESSFELEGQISPSALHPESAESAPTLDVAENECYSESESSVLSSLPAEIEYSIHTPSNASQTDDKPANDSLPSVESDHHASELRQLEATIGDAHQDLQRPKESLETTDIDRNMLCKKNEDEIECECDYIKPLTAVVSIAKPQFRSSNESSDSLNCKSAYEDCSFKDSGNKRSSENSSQLQIHGDVGTTNEENDLQPESTLHYCRFTGARCCDHLSLMYAKSDENIAEEPNKEAESVLNASTSTRKECVDDSTARNSNSDENNFSAEDDRNKINENKDSENIADEKITAGEFLGNTESDTNEMEVTESDFQKVEAVNIQSENEELQKHKDNLEIQDISDNAKEDVFECIDKSNKNTVVDQTEHEISNQLSDNESVSTAHPEKYNVNQSSTCLKNITDNDKICSNMLGNEQQPCNDNTTHNCDLNIDNELKNIIQQDENKNVCTSGINTEPQRKNSCEETCIRYVDVDDVFSDGSISSEHQDLFDRNAETNEPNSILPDENVHIFSNTEKQDALSENLENSKIPDEINLEMHLNTEKGDINSGQFCSDKQNNDDNLNEDVLVIEKSEPTPLLQNLTETNSFSADINNQEHSGTSKETTNKNHSKETEDVQEELSHELQEYLEMKDSIHSEIKSASECSNTIDKSQDGVSDIAEDHEDLETNFGREFSVLDNVGKLNSILEDELITEDHLEKFDTKPLKTSEETEESSVDANVESQDNDSCTKEQSSSYELPPDKGKTRRLDGDQAVKFVDSADSCETLFQNQIVSDVVYEELNQKDANLLESDNHVSSEHSDDDDVKTVESDGAVDSKEGSSYLRPVSAYSTSDDMEFVSPSPQNQLTPEQRSCQTQSSRGDSGKCSTVSEGCQTEFLDSALRSRLMELEAVVSEIVEVKEHHMKVACDVAEQLEELRAQEARWSGKAMRYQDEISAWKENVELQNVVLQKLRDELENCQTLLEKKETDVGQLRRKIDELQTRIHSSCMGTDRLSLKDKAVQTSDEENRNLMEYIDQLRREAESHKEQMQQRETLIDGARKQVQQTMLHLVSLKSEAMQKIQKETDQWHGLIQAKDEEIQHLKSELSHVSTLVEEKGCMNNQQMKTIKGLMTELGRCENALAARAASTKQPEMGDSSIQTEEEKIVTLGERCLVDHHSETISNQTKLLQELQTKVRNLELQMKLGEEIEKESIMTNSMSSVHAGQHVVRHPTSSELAIKGYRVHTKNDHSHLDFLSTVLKKAQQNLEDEQLYTKKTLKQSPSGKTVKDKNLPLPYRNGRLLFLQQDLESRRKEILKTEMKLRKLQAKVADEAKKANPPLRAN